MTSWTIHILNGRGGETGSGVVVLWNLIVHFMTSQRDCFQDQKQKEKSGGLDFAHLSGIQWLAGVVDYW